MSITCQICNTEFEKIIPWQHLAKHQMSSKDYKEKHGSLYSSDTLEKFASRVPHNKGKKLTDPIKLEQLRESIKKREARYAAGEIKRAGPNWDENQKKHLSEKTKQYAKNNPEEMKRRTAKAIQTKIENNYDFGCSMRGKHLSQETKDKISLKSLESNKEKALLANNRILEKISQLELVLNNDVSNHNLDLTCLKCNSNFSFTKQYFHPAKFKVNMCPTCYPRSKPTSKSESEMFDFLKNLEPTAIQSYRTHYHSLEIDTFIPEKKVGFEFNGLYWHSEPVLLYNNKSKISDYEKLKKFSNDGIRLIQIFEDEWANKRHIVESRIKNILGHTGQVIYARKCSIKEVTSSDSSKFCEITHIMGKGRSNVRLGLFYGEELVSLMTFTKNNLSRKSTSWEINRFSSKLDTVVIGAASKLFAAFLKLKKPNQVISYSDNRWSTGNLYKSLGFVLDNPGSPNYWYILPNVGHRIHRFGLRKPTGCKVTESELRESEGYSKVWDSGSSKWIYTA